MDLTSFKRIVCGFPQREHTRKDTGTESRYYYIIFVCGSQAFVPSLAEKVKGEWRTVESGQWRVDSGEWTVDSGEWAADSGQRMVNGEKEAMKRNRRKVCNPTK